jgi:Putative Flp pilus-assembly TadE/G-like
MGSRAQRGQAIVLVAVMLGVVVGMAALAIDGSRAYASRRDLQAGIDAASLAAADTFERSGSYASAEAAASTSFGTNLRLYTAPSCSPGYGSPGAAGFTVTCTYSDGTQLVQTVTADGPRGSRFQLTATRTLQLQFGRILTNGTTPNVSTTAAARVNNLFYAPVVSALGQNGCGGAAGTAISVNGSGTLTVLGDVVSNGTIGGTSGAGTVAGDIYARCQSSISGATLGCYPSGAAAPCTYPDVLGAIRPGNRLADPGYPAPGPLGAGQPAPGTTVNLLPGVYSSLVNVSSCYFLVGGVYDFTAGFTNAGGIVSNELKPPDEPSASNNQTLAAVQFWNTAAPDCAGSVQVTAVQCTGNNPCGSGNCGNGQGNGQGNGCSTAPSGDWSVEVTSTRTDTYGGSTYQRESAPSMCRVVHVGNNQAIQVVVSNVPGATSYSVYASPNNTCNGPFGLADLLPVAAAPLNNNLGGCPAFTGTTCSLGNEFITLNGYDIGSPWAPNALASPGTLGAYPPSSETAPLAPGKPNQNPPRGAGSSGDRANENNCESTAGGYATCPTAVTPGAVALYLPPPGCLSSLNTSDSYLFSGYQYNWIALYEPASNTCSNSYGAVSNSAFVGLVYTPGASMSITSSNTFEVAATAGVMANTLTFSGSLPSITYGAAYAPVPFASRLVS